MHPNPAEGAACLVQLKVQSVREDGTVGLAVHSYLPPAPTRIDPQLRRFARLPETDRPSWVDCLRPAQWRPAPTPLPAVPCLLHRIGCGHGPRAAK